MLLRLRTLLLVTLWLALPLKGMAAVGFLACAPGDLLPSAALAAPATLPCHGDGGMAMEHPADAAPDALSDGASDPAPDGLSGHHASSKPGCQTCAPCCSPALPTPLPHWAASAMVQAAPAMAIDLGAADAPNTGLDRPPRPGR